MWLRLPRVVLKLPNAVEADLIKIGSRRRAPKLWWQMASASIPAPPLPSRQATPSDTKGILSNGNVKLDERLDLLDFLDTIEAPGEAPSGSSSSSSEAPTVVGVSTLPAAAVGWSSSSFAPQHSSSYGFGSSFGSRRQHYSTALEVARDAEVQSSLNIMQDEIPTEAPWWLQASYCFCTPPPCCDFSSLAAPCVSHSLLPCVRTRSISMLWRGADDAAHGRFIAAKAAAKA